MLNATDLMNLTLTKNFFGFVVHHLLCTIKVNSLRLDFFVTKKKNYNFNLKII